MPQFRIPFTSRKPSISNGVEVNDENARPAVHGTEFSSPYSNKASLALGIKERREEPNEFKLSSVDASGQYLPPSPPEKKSFWSKSPSGSSNHRSLVSENEPFSISRESFESYRRSFDVSGRSPIIQSDSFTSRTSLDSRGSFARLPRPSMNGTTFERPIPPRVADEGFEDVKLNDESMKPPKKKGFLARFGEQSPSDPSNPEGKPLENKSHHFHLPGRKRGQSGTGAAELGEVNRPNSKGTPEVTVR